MTNFANISKTDDDDEDYNVGATQGSIWPNYSPSIPAGNVAGSANGGIIVTPVGSGTVTNITAPSPIGTLSPAQIISIGGGSAVISTSQLNGVSIAQTPKYSNITYIVKCKDGRSLTLQEEKSITPREMIGISKFISVVSAMAANVRGEVRWSELITNLGIERHFKEVQAVNPDILQIILTDPK